MFESDADRLASIKGLGGQLVSHESGSFWAIFDRAFLLSTDGAVETRRPVLEARTIDVADLPKDTALAIGDEVYQIVRHEPDGTGMTIVLLKR